MDIGESCDRHRHTSRRPSGEHHRKHSRDDGHCSISQRSPKQAAHGSSNPSSQRTAGVFTDPIAALWQRLATKRHAHCGETRPGHAIEKGNHLQCYLEEHRASVPERPKFMTALIKEFSLLPYNGEQAEDSFDLELPPPSPATMPYIEVSIGQTFDSKNWRHGRLCGHVSAKGLCCIALALRVENMRTCFFKCASGNVDTSILRARGRESGDRWRE